MLDYRLGALVVTGILAAGCAIRLGGPQDLDFQMLLMSPHRQHTAEQVAGHIHEAGSRSVMMAAPQDSVWFQEVAERSNLELSGPAVDDDLSFAFLSGDAKRDTTVALGIGQRSILLHHAVYRLDREGPMRRTTNLLALRMDPDMDRRSVVRSLLDYIADNVSHDASLLIAVDLPDSQAADALARTLRPLLRDGRDCLPEDMPQDGQGLYLFYGPELRLECTDARLLDMPFPAMLVKLVAPR